jgi:hypothetical protein
VALFKNLRTVGYLSIFARNMNGCLNFIPKNRFNFHLMNLLPQPQVENLGKGVLFWLASYHFYFLSFNGINDERVNAFASLTF